MKSTLIISLSFLLLCPFTSYLNAQSLVEKQVQLTDQIDRYVTEEMKKRQIPGLALGICEGDNLVKVASYGYADVQNLGTVQDNTVFELASITKQFTAGAIMLLVQDGEVKLEEPITTYIEDSPAEWSRITVKHLLAHTSGLPALGEPFPGMFSFTPQEYAQAIVSLSLTKENYFQLVKTNVLNFDPGDRFSYSDTGYFLLRNIIDVITGSYRKFIQNTIFEKLGMGSSYIVDQISVHHLEARGYTLRNGELVNIRRVLDVETPSHYGIFSNIIDLQKWDAALNSNILFTNESKDVLWKDTRLNGGGYTGYSLGWYTNKINNKLIVSHTGITGTEMIKFVDEGVSFIVLTNLGTGDYDRVNSWGIASDVAKMFGYDYLIGEGYITKGGNKIVVSEKGILDKMVGNYRLSDNQKRRIYIEDGKLYYERSKESRSELRALDNGNFIMLGIPYELILEIKKDDYNTFRWSTGEGGVLTRE